jgi:hypothetical protein
MRHAAGRWLWRYLPAELGATVAALVGAVVAADGTDSPALIALAAAWTETVAYYTVMLGREIVTDRRLTATYGVRQLLRTGRNLGIEFGVAEVLDTLLVRPAVLLLALEVMPDLAVAVVMGKLVADALFYVTAITMYEFRRRSIA